MPSVEIRVGHLVHLSVEHLRIYPGRGAWLVTEIVGQYLICRRGMRSNSKALRVSTDAVVGWSRNWIGHYKQRAQPTPDMAVFIRGHLQPNADDKLKAKRKNHKPQRGIELGD